MKGVIRPAGCISGDPVWGGRLWGWSGGDGRLWGRSGWDERLWGGQDGVGGVGAAGPEERAQALPASM